MARQSRALDDDDDVLPAGSSPVVRRGPGPVVGPAQAGRRSSLLPPLPPLPPPEVVLSETRQ